MFYMFQKVGGDEVEQSTVNGGDGEMRLLMRVYQRDMADIGKETRDDVEVGEICKEIMRVSDEQLMKMEAMEEH